MTAIILAAGSGSRLAPLSLTTPKPLIPILNRPLLDHQLSALAPFVQRAIVVVAPGWTGAAIRAFLAQRHGALDVVVVVQPEATGTGSAVAAAIPAVPPDETSLIILNGDDLYARDDLGTLTHHAAAVLGQTVTDWGKWGIIQTDERGRMLGLVEKPTVHVGDLAYTGASVVPIDFLDLVTALPLSPRGEYEITDAFARLAATTAVQAVPTSGPWLPIGYPWHILAAHETLLSSMPASQHMRIGQDCHIGDHVRLTGTTIIGDGVTIGDGARIHAATIGSGSTIGPGADVRHAVLGRNVRLDRNVTTLDTTLDGSTVRSMIKGQSVDTGRSHFGATIGDDATIETDATIAPGVKIWPGLTVPSGRCEHDCVS